MQQVARPVDYVTPAATHFSWLAMVHVHEVGGQPANLASPTGAFPDCLTLRRGDAAHESLHRRHQRHNQPPQLPQRRISRSVEVTWSP